MKIIEIYGEARYEAITLNIARKHETDLLHHGPQNEGKDFFLRLLVQPQHRQAFLDELQTHLEASPSTRLIVIPVEATLPHPEVPKQEETQAATTTREELYTSIEKSVRLDYTFLLLVFLSTVVVAIGLIEDNVAVVIGAMVIAPLLGPNLALALATALGDTQLMWKAVKSGGAGMALALVLSVIIGMIWPVNFKSHELMARTDVALDSVALALASGFAAVVSMTTGLSSVLVGVMVAVALLPPTATIGLMLGRGHYKLAMGAALLLAVNIVCVNLSAKLAFLMRGISPRTFWEKKKAKRSMQIYIAVWVLSLAILVGAIYYLHR